LQSQAHRHLHLLIGRILRVAFGT